VAFTNGEPDLRPAFGKFSLISRSAGVGSLAQEHCVAIVLRQATLHDVEIRELHVSGEFSLLLSFGGSKRK
jgi:hypothetical protein